MKLSLIIPCYNEEENVNPLFDAICGVLDGNIESYELIFINDGSTDKTMAKLKELSANTEIPIKIINFSRNFGKEAGIYAGLEEAEGDYICLIDADLQQNPKFVLKMVQTLDEHEEYDCVAAYQKERHESRRNIFFKNTFYKMMNKISDTDFVNGASDFRTFRRCVRDAILSMPEYHRFSKGIFTWVGFNTHYMPYDADARLNGTSKWSFWKLFKYAIEGIVAFTTVPLRMSSFVGLLSSAASIIYLIIVIIQKLAFGIAVPGYATIVVLILLIGGLQLAALGIIGEYLARTYVQTKQRPIYVAREVISNKEDGREVKDKST